jgi:hypothetical protein
MPSGQDGRSGSVRARLLAVLADLGLVLDGSFTYPLTVEVRDARGATVSFRVDGAADLQLDPLANLSPTERRIVQAAPPEAEAVTRRKLARLSGQKFNSYFHGLLRGLKDRGLLGETSSEKVYRK